MKNKNIPLNIDEIIEQIKEKVCNNIIEVGGVVVQSNRSLQECEKCVNRLIKKHQNYLLLKKEMIMKTGYAG